MSEKLNELRELRGKAIHDMRAVVDAAGGDALSTDQQEVYDRAYADQEKYADAIKREETMQNLEREAATRVVEAAPELQGATEATAILAMDAFNMALANGIQNLTPDVLNALQVDDDNAGGYMVPPEQFVSDLIQAVDDMTYIRGKATVIPTTAKSLGIPALDNDPADADWTTELATGSEDSTMDFGKRELSPHPLAKLIKVSNTLLRKSAIPAESLVRERLAYKFAITEEKAFLTGNGAAQPLGLMTASANGISTSRDVSTGNTTTSIQTDGLLEAKYSLKAQYWNNSEWLFHRDALKQIAKLKDGEGQYIWNQSIVTGQPDRLLGMPFNMSEYQSNTFTTGLYVGMLGDFSKYWIADSLSMTVQRLQELYAATNQVGFIGRMELDGMPVLEEAFARVKLA